MHNEYYGAATTPTDDYLAHYGIKGMKWGVIKARSSGSDKKLHKQWVKASTKLEKLRRKSDPVLQKELAKRQGEKARLSSVDAGLAGTIAAMNIGLNGSLPYISGPATAVGLGRAAYHLVRRAKHKSNASAKGNVKATEKYNEWNREMKEAFKGTKYAGKVQPSSSPKIINRPNTSGLNKKYASDINKGLDQWAKSFEKHYQNGLSKGMTHEQAERYSNDYIAKHGFASNKKKRG